MDNQQPTGRESLMREKALYWYMDAFERSDFENMARILQQAEHDPELEEMIWEVQAAYLNEQEAERQEKDIALVRQLLRKHLPSGLATTQTVEEIPQLTVSDVVARMQADEPVKGPLGQEFHGVVQQLRQSRVPLPHNLGVQGIRWPTMGGSVSPLDAHCHPRSEHASRRVNAHCCYPDLDGRIMGAGTTGPGKAAACSSRQVRKGVTSSPETWPAACASCNRPPKTI